VAERLLFEAAGANPGVVPGGADRATVDRGPSKREQVEPA
jgi:hypothetical protein